MTIGGEPFVHMLCHVVLPYSNWGWVTVCRSESLSALKRGLQEGVYRLGRVAAYHQTDNSTAATHTITSGEQIFNRDYVEFIHHLGMEPRTIAVGRKNQNGDVEALHGALKRRMKQHLLMRGSNDFDSLGEYEEWLTQVMEKANRLRTRRLNEEIAVIRPVPVERFPEFVEQEIRVSGRSTIHVKHNAYSVPSRLIGELVRVRIYDDRLEVYYRGTHQMTVERLLGRGGHRINYRHIIWSLVRKPGAFRLYKYREDMFPSVTFRRAYDALCTKQGDRKGSLEYLRILHLAASTTESDVEAALELVLEDQTLLSRDQIKALVGTNSLVAPPQIVAPMVDLSCYDALLYSLQEVA